MSKKITMADIAEMSGVAKSTVSRYFNGGYVKDSTKKKIQAVIQAQNYEPNTFARLNAKNSNVIGVVVPTLNSKVTSRVITSIDRYLRGQGYETIIKNSDHDPKLELDNIKRLISLNVDGILFSAINITDEHRQLISNSSVPVVVLAQEYDEGISVVDDDRRAGRCAGEYIGKTHPQCAAYIGVDESDIAVGIGRRQGVLDGLKEYGIDNPVILTGDYSFESGQALTEKLLELAKPDAIICATDRLAFGAYRVLEQHGLRIPEDVSVMGFGGYDESALLKPQLTTIKFDSYAVGYLGAETLLKMIHGEPVPQKQTVGFTLIEGGSVKKC
ncbi:LacI family transcriptional regulator [Clostridium sp. chh4-2]|uniref:LacI family DNA-binding transcriptional regulator n=1 Tax=Clostridium sp. chh4-2 TaxID=2067550 RepID=UPI000CCF2AAB|nr:LacI family DNA-binding transcriptional regulator [Clostridium sp. chh4-2]PNV61685.1 LacI family transcriptional regulator [Clostridium sp. chh4-2]